MKKTAFLLCMALALLQGCSATRRTAVVEHTVHDTLWRQSRLYDSIYIDNTTLIRQRADTVYVHDRRTAYRYRLVHDTTYIHRTDTVPVVREVERVRHVRYIPPWCRLLSGVGIGCLLYVLGRLFRRVAWQ